MEHFNFKFASTPLPKITEVSQPETIQNALKLATESATIRAQPPQQQPSQQPTSTYTNPFVNARDTNDQGLASMDTSK